MDRAAEIVESVEQQLGIDAYHVYPNTRRMIPDAVLWGVAAACVIEFIKGLVDFKKLGEDSRAKLTELARRWREHDDLERYIEAERLEPSFRLAIEAMPLRVSPTEQKAAQKNLEEALIEFGLDQHAARRHAAKISGFLLNNASEP